MKRLFGGIYWAIEPEDRAFTMLELDLPSGAIRIMELVSPISTNDIARLFVNRTVTVIAVDVPFGWPAPLSHFMGSWSPTNGSPWLHPPIDDMRWRMTDRYVKSETPPYKWVESLPSDANLLRTNKWIELAFCQSWTPQIDVVGKLTDNDGRPTCIETNHEATLRALRMDSDLDGPSSNGDAEALRTEAMKGFVEMFKIRKNDKQFAMLCSDAKLAKSFVNAVTGIIYWSEVSDTEDGAGVVLKFGVGIERPTAEQIEKTTKEGWIFFPRKL